MIVNQSVVEHYFRRDINWINLEKLLELNFLELEVGVNFPRLLLIGTNFCFYPGDDGRYCYRKGWVIVERPGTSPMKLTSFEFVLENCPNRFKQELIWHMDLLQ